MDYDVKYSQQLQAIKENYATFGVPYNGTDNDDYVDGEGFCCDDGTIEASMAQANAPEDNFQEGDAYEDLQFYYHPDHLGSSYITNLDGEVVQHIEYVQFGEVFIEERNNIWNTPYLFNAKEFDEETGLYYYGARYYDPKLSLWISVDPLATYDPIMNSEHYLDGEHNLGIFNSYNLNPYAYCYQMPIKLYDSNGKQAWAQGIITWIGLDTATPEPTDILPAKWVAYAVIGAVATTAIIIHESTDVNNDNQQIIVPYNSKIKDDSKSQVRNNERRNNDDSSKIQKSGKKPSNSGKNERHGDNGRAKSKAEKQIQDLEKQLNNNISKKEKAKIQRKINNIRRTAEGKKHGEEHSRTIKR